MTFVLTASTNSTDWNKKYWLKWIAIDSVINLILSSLMFDSHVCYIIRRVILMILLMFPSGADDWN